MKFEELELSEKIKKALTEIGHIDVTKIQEETIPQILKGGDLIGQSQTGTGKTAAFGLPIIEAINSEEKGVQAIILCPTRELAVQVSEEMRKYTKYLENVKIIAIYGGQAIERQIMALKKGVQIVIGTPGRIMDHMRRKTLKLNNVKTIVLDEADEMLNMGFEEDIETILKDIPKERQTILFSATMNKKIMNITKKYLKDPKHIKIQAKELTVANTKQTYIEMKQAMKNEALTRIIDLKKPRRVIVFCNTKRKVDDQIDLLKSSGYKAEALHGDIKQVQRDRIMKNFKNGEFQILVATDVVARGIDIEDLDLVINYDLPKEEEYYVHRIGRTGRNQNQGESITFIVGKEKFKLREIERYANTKIQEIKIPTITEIKEIKNKEIQDKIQKVIDKGEFENIELFDKLKEKNQDVNLISKALITMFTKQKNKNLTIKRTEINDEKRFKSEKINTKNGYIKLFFNLGKIDKIAVKDIVGSITANTAIKGTEIGKVNLLDKFTFVEIPKEYLEEIMESMKEKQIKGKDVNIEIAKN